MECEQAISDQLLEAVRTNPTKNKRSPFSHTLILCNSLITTSVIPEVGSIELQRCTFNDWTMFAALMANCHIQQLALISCGMQDSHMPPLNGIPLRKLTLDDNLLTSQCLPKLRIPSLRSLTINSNPLNDQQSCTPLIRFIIWWGIRNLDVPMPNVKLIEERLDMSGSKLLMLLRNCPNLELLSISNNYSKGTCLTELLQLPALSKLKIQRRRIDEVTCSRISQSLLRLEELQLCGSKLTNEVARAIATHLPRLSYLEADYSGMTVAGATTLLAGLTVQRMSVFNNFRTVKRRVWMRLRKAFPRVKFLNEWLIDNPYMWGDAP